MPQVLFTFWILFGLVFSVHASQRSFIQDLQTPQMEVISETHPYFDEKLGEYPWFASWFQWPAFKWIPKGRPRIEKENCRLWDWQGQVLAETRRSFQSLSLAFEKKLEECKEEFQNGPKDLFSNTYLSVMPELKIFDHPWGQHVLFRLPGGVQLKGFLALKPDRQRRPLVIFRTGIFSNTQEFYAERYLFMMAFEQSPFHVLVLESISGSEFVKHNSSHSAFGFDEGIQNFLVARLLQRKDQPISQKISSVHMMGISMGGHGALFAALLNDLNPKPNGDKVLQSTLVFCPLLNPRETFDFHQSFEPNNRALNSWASERLSVLKMHYPRLKNSSFVADFFSELNQSYQGPLSSDPELRFPKEIEKLLAGKERDFFWRVNDFWSSYQNIQTPVFNFSTVQDPFVSWPLNSGRLRDGRINLKNSNFKLFSFDEAYHCSFSVAYDWNFLSTLIQTYFLYHSPEFTTEKREFRFKVQNETQDLNGADNNLIRVFFVEDQQLKAKIILKNHSKWNFLSHFNLVRESHWIVPIPLAQTDFRSQKVLESSAGEDMVVRWAEQNIRLKLEKKNPTLPTEFVLSWPVAGS